MEYKSLFQYSLDMNAALIDRMQSSEAPLPEAHRFMSHILNAHLIWASRILGSQDPPEVWHTYTPDQLHAINLESHQVYFNILDEDPDLHSIIDYQNSKGETYFGRLEDLLYHVLNHATHHRAQISLLLRQAGQAPPPTDYVFYLR